MYRSFIKRLHWATENKIRKYVTVQWSTTLLCSHDVPGPILNLWAYPEICLYFPQSLKANAGIVHKTASGTDCFLYVCLETL